MRFFAVLILMISSFTTQAANMKESVLFAVAASGMCSIYAGQLDLDPEPFKKMNMLTLKMSEKLEYTSNFNSFVSNVESIRSLLSEQLLQKYGSKSDIYNDWCINYHKSFITGIEAGSK